MPLTPGSSKAVIGKNIEEMQKSGHPHNQAVAASLHNAMDGEFEESKHPRGQPGNAGEFASGSGGSNSGHTITKEYTGHISGKPQEVVRHRGTFVGSAPTNEEAQKIMNHHEATRPDTLRLKANSLAPGLLKSSMHKQADKEDAEALQRGANAAAEFEGPTPATPENNANKTFNKNDDFDLFSPEEQAMAKKSGSEFASKQAENHPMTPRKELNSVKNVIHGAVKEGKAFSGGEAARQQVAAKGISSAHHEIGDHVSYGPGKGGQIINLTHSHAIIQQPDGAGHSASVTVPLEQITDNWDKPHRDFKAKSSEPTKDALPGMVTQPNSGGPAYKGRNLDDNPVGDTYGSADCAAAGDCGWPGRVV